MGTIIHLNSYRPSKRKTEDVRELRSTTGEKSISVGDLWGRFEKYGFPLYRVERIEWKRSWFRKAQALIHLSRETHGTGTYRMYEKRFRSKFVRFDQDLFDFVARFQRIRANLE